MWCVCTRRSLQLCCVGLFVAGPPSRTPGPGGGLVPRHNSSSKVSLAVMESGVANVGACDQQTTRTQKHKHRSAWLWCRATHLFCHTYHTSYIRLFVCITAHGFWQRWPHEPPVGWVIVPTHLAYAPHHHAPYIYTLQYCTNWRGRIAAACVSDFFYSN